MTLLLSETKGETFRPGYFARQFKARATPRAFFLFALPLGHTLRLTAAQDWGAPNALHALRSIFLKHPMQGGPDGRIVMWGENPLW